MFLDLNCCLNANDSFQTFANVVILPSIFHFNGITQLSEVPDDIKNRYQWRCVTRPQLDEDTNVFLRNYPFDVCEGATRILNGRAARKQKSQTAKSTAHKARNNHFPGRNQQERRSGFNRSRGRGGQFATPTNHRGNSSFKPSG